jgi:NAD(P)-dependent dehydrogenase (short-subunit alcohol dehydrogenase family)
MTRPEFTGLHVVVTGSGSGIGLEICEQLHADGAIVYGLDVNEGSLGENGTWIQCDVGDSESVKTAFEKIYSHTPVIDVVLNNAGVSAVGTVEDTTDEQWSRVLNINVVGMSRIATAALPGLRKSKSASIVNTCSIAATAGLPKRVIYSASKGAVLSLTLAMAADHIHENIRVNCVAPGTADTPWVKRLLASAADPDAEKRALEARQPMGRLVSATEVANAILYLASPNQSSTTGTVLAVDGGMQGLRLPK